MGKGTLSEDESAKALAEDKTLESGETLDDDAAPIVSELEDSAIGRMEELEPAPLELDVSAGFVFLFSISAHKFRTESFGAAFGCKAFTGKPAGEPQCRKKQ